jgi:hypothetical protein
MQKYGLDKPDLGSANQWKMMMDDPKKMVEAYLGTTTLPTGCKYVEKSPKHSRGLLRAIYSATFVICSKQNFNHKKIQNNNIIYLFLCPVHNFLSKYPYLHCSFTGRWLLQLIETSIRPPVQRKKYVTISFFELGDEQTSRAAVGDDNL